jgi:hypothetical protein
MRLRIHGLRQRRQSSFCHSCGTCEHHGLARDWLFRYENVAQIELSGNRCASAQERRHYLRLCVTQGALR